jgi:hypothetical protein
LSPERSRCFARRFAPIDVRNASRGAAHRRLRPVSADRRARLRRAVLVLREGGHAMRSHIPRAGGDPLLPVPIPQFVAPPAPRRPDPARSLDDRGSAAKQGTSEPPPRSADHPIADQPGFPVLERAGADRSRAPSHEVAENKADRALPEATKDIFGQTSPPPPTPSPTPPQSPSSAASEPQPPPRRPQRVRAPRPDAEPARVPGVPPASFRRVMGPAERPLAGVIESAVVNCGCRTAVVSVAVDVNDSRDRVLVLELPEGRLEGGAGFARALASRLLAAAEKVSPRSPRKDR